MVLQFVQVMMLVAGCAALSVGGGSGLSGSSLGPAVGSPMFGQGATAAVNADAKVVAAFQDQIQKYHRRSQEGGKLAPAVARGSHSRADRQEPARACPTDPGSTDRSAAG